MGRKKKNKSGSNPPSPEIKPDSSNSPRDTSEDGFLVVEDKPASPTAPSTDEDLVFIKSPIDETMAEIAMDAEQLKEEGNAFYKAADYPAALKKYDAGLEWAENDKLKIAILGNRSMCHMQVGDYVAQLRCVTLEMGQVIFS